MTPTDIALLQRLADAANAVRAQFESGALFEGYEGAEPQRSQAVAALDELDAATVAAGEHLSRLRRTHPL